MLSRQSECPSASHDTKGRYLAVAAAVLLTGVAGGRASQPALETRSFEEEYRKERVPASGGVRQGVLRGPPEGRVDPSALHVWLPVEGGPTFCVEIASRDGRYQARMSYAHPGLSGLYRVAFPTRHTSELRRYRARELASLAYPATECVLTSRVRDVYPTQWSNEVDSRELTVFVRSGGADVDVRLLSVDGRKTGLCREPEESGKLAYDTECRLDLQGDPYVELRLLREEFESPFPPVQFRLFAPRVP